MFRHIVLFQWNDQATPESVAGFAAALKACAAALPGVVAYECGPEVTHGSADRPGDRYDFGLVADFEDRAAWQGYDADPEHNRIRAELLRPMLATRVTVQLDL